VSKFYRFDFPQDSHCYEAYESLVEAQASANEDTEFVLEVVGKWEPYLHIDGRKRIGSRYTITGWKQEMQPHEEGG
jgi:hypothetical protein